MTKREMFAEIRKVVADNAEMVAFIDHEVELLNRKSGGQRKPTKTQLENAEFKATIVAHLAEVGAPKTIKELQAEIPEIAGLTNQRVTHMLTDLVKGGTLNKEYVKRTPYYFTVAQKISLPPKWGGHRKVACPTGARPGDFSNENKKLAVDKFFKI